MRVAQKNVERNDVTKSIEVKLGSADTGSGLYDVILANIIASVIAEIAVDLAARLAPDGVLIASGIIEERLAGVEAALGLAGLVVAERRRSGDWVCLLARKPA